MKKILIIVLSCMSLSVNAETVKCVDSYTNGEVFKVSINWYNGSVVVNNRKLIMKHENKEGSGITTNNFKGNTHYVIYHQYYENREVIQQVFIDEENKVQPTGLLYPLTCSTSFIKPFLKNKYS